MLFGGGVSLALVVLSLFWRRRPRAGSSGAAGIPPICRSAGPQWLDAATRRNARRISCVASTPPAIVRQQRSRRLIDHLDALLYNPDVACNQEALRTLRSGLRRLQVDVALRARS